MSGEADMFDELRKIRNGINYYGRKVNKEEAEKIINKLKMLISKFKKPTTSQNYFNQQTTVNFKYMFWQYLLCKRRC